MPAFHSHDSASSPWLPALPMPLSTRRSLSVHRGYAILSAIRNLDGSNIELKRPGILVTHSKFLQTDSDALDSLHLLAIGGLDALLCFSLVAETVVFLSAVMALSDGALRLNLHVSVTPEEDIVTCVSNENQQNNSLVWPLQKDRSHIR